MATSVSSATLILICVWIKSHNLDSSALTTSSNDSVAQIREKRKKKKKLNLAQVVCVYRHERETEKGGACYSVVVKAVEVQSSV